MQGGQAAFLDLVGEPLAQITATVHRPGARLQPGQEQVADQGRHQHRAKHQHQAGGQRQHKELEEAQDEGAQRIDGTVLKQRPHRDRVHIQPVDQQEGREHRHEEQGGDAQTAHRIDQHFPDTPGGAGTHALRHAAGIEVRHRLGGRARPDAACGLLLAIAEAGLPFEVGPIAQAGVALQHHIGANAGLGADIDAAQQQPAALDPGVFQAHHIAYAGTSANAQQIGGAHRHRAQHHVLAHVGTQGPQPQREQRGARDHAHGHGLDQAVRQPPAEVGQPPQRVATRLEPAGNQPLAGPGHGKLQHRGQRKGQYRYRNGHSHRVVLVTGEEVVGEERRQPLRHLDQHQKRDGQRLRGATAPTAQRRMLAKGTGRCRRCIVRHHAGLQRLGNRAHAALLVDGADGGLCKARIGAQHRRQPRSKQRVATQVAEEIQRAPDGLAREDLRQRGKQHFLGRGLGGVRVTAVNGGTQCSRAQRLAVDLARGQTRHQRQRLKTGRHHIGRQALGQRAAQRRMAGGRVQRHIKGHQLVDAIVLAQQHRRGAHTGLLGQHRLDLAQLHAEATDLHLVIGPAQALHLAFFIDARQVAGAVEARVMRPRRPGVVQKLLGRQLRPAQVAGGHTGAGNAQLAHLSGRQAHQLGRRACGKAVRVDHLHHHHAVVGQRRANGHGLTRLQLGQARRYGGLGRPIGVEQLAGRTGAGAGPAVDQRLRAHLAAQVDDAQAGHILRKQRQQRGHGMQHGDLLVQQGLGQRLGVAGNLARRNPQGGAHQVADPDLLERHVKGHREALVDLVAQAHAQARILAAQKVADAALVDGDALGLAGRTAGVDHIGGVAGLGIATPARCGAGGQLGQQVHIGP